jgi:WD40 repeat protein
VCILDIALSEDHLALVAEEGASRSVVLWSEGSAAEVYQTIEDAGVVDWSPDGENLAIGTDGGDIYLWDPSNSLTTVGNIEAGVRSVVYSPDGQWLAAGYEDGTTRLWPMARQNDGLPILNESFHTSAVTAISWDVGSLTTATVGGKELWLHDTHGYPVAGVEYDEKVLSVAWSVDDKIAVSLDIDQQGPEDLDVYNILIYHFPGLGDFVSDAYIKGGATDLVWSPDGVALAQNGEYFVINYLGLWPGLAHPPALIPCIYESDPQGSSWRKGEIPAAGIGLIVHSFSPLFNFSCMCTNQS